VVAEHRLPLHLAVQGEHASAVRTSRHQIADKEHAIARTGGDLIQQAAEFGDATMDVTDDDRAHHPQEF
jgi:hypothetical protein